MQQPPTQNSTQSTGQGASGAVEELTSDAKQIGSSAANRIHSEVDARKGEAAGQAKSVSSAIQRAADGLDEGAPTWLKSAFQQGAEQIQRFADGIEQKDSRQLMSDAQTFARDNPGTFLAACAAAGFAAARVLKAGGEPATGQSGAFGQANRPTQPGVEDYPGLGSTSGQSSSGANARGEFV